MSLSACENYDSKNPTVSLVAKHHFNFVLSCDVLQAATCFVHVDLGKVSSTAFVSDKFVERALTRPVVMIDRNLLRRQLPVVLIRQILSNDENHQFYVVKMVQNSSLEHRGQHFIFRNHDHKSKNAIKRSWRGSAVVVRIVGIHNWNCAAS